jgi:hypothetical protein
MIDHCYAVSGEINSLFFISSLLSLNYVFYFYVFLFYKTKTKSNIFLIKLYLISKSLIIIPTQSLRFDTLSIALSYKDSFYCEWLILLLIYFGKQKTTSQTQEIHYPKTKLVTRHSYSHTLMQ